MDATTAGPEPITSRAPVSRTLISIAAIAAPVLCTIGTLLDWTGGGPDPLVYLAKLQENPGVYLASGLLLVAGAALLPVTAIALVQVAAGRERAGLLRVGAVLLAAWGILAVGGISVGYTAGWVAADLVGVAPNEIVRQVFTGITYGPWGSIGGGLGGLAFALGMLATGIGIILTRGLPNWPGILVLAGTALAFTGGPLGLHWVSSSGFILLLIAIAALVPRRP